MLKKPPKRNNMGKITDLINSLHNRRGEVKCHCCGKKLEVPNMYKDADRRKLQPYCCATSLLHVQWLIHHGWHVRNLGLHDPHPFFCPDCWKDGTPEYGKREYCETWCQQAQDWMNET